MPRVPRIPGVPGGATRRPDYTPPGGDRTPEVDRTPSTRRDPDRSDPDRSDPDGRGDRSTPHRSDPDGRGNPDRTDDRGEGDRADRPEVSPPDINITIENGDGTGSGTGTGNGTCAPGTEPAGGESSGPLSEQCDTEGVTGAINRVTETLRKVQDMFNQGLNMLSDAIAAVQRVTLGLIPWLDGIQASVKIAQFQMNMQYNAIIEVIEQLTAPWFIKCFGDKIVQGIGPKIEAFDQQVDPKNRASYYSWHGEAADKFFARAGLQYEASGDALAGVMKFGQEMQIMGDIGISATLTFLADLAICMVELIMAIVEIALVPVGTAVSIGQILAVVVQVLALIAIFVAFCMAASNSSNQFIAAVENVPMSGEWPKGVA